MLAPTILAPGTSPRLFHPAKAVPLYRGWSWLQPPNQSSSSARPDDAEIIALTAAAHAGLRTWHCFYGETAAMIHGCNTVYRDGNIHLIQRHNQQRSAHPRVKRHSAALRAEEMTVLDGLPVTSLSRTVVDCARTLTLGRALVIADSALRLGLTTEELNSALIHARGSRGIRQAQMISDLADPLAESPGESLLRLVIVQGGLPTPELQIAVDTHLGRRYVDLGWSSVKVAVEFDGRVKYDTSGNGANSTFYEEKRRQDALEELGWLVVRVMWEDLGNPSALVARLREAIHRQQHRRSVI